MMQTFVEQLAFALDPFQAEAIEQISHGHSVVVCAPTGSGKTIIAEYAAHTAMREGSRLFYTTPLKALSNQKYQDFCQQFGADNVGLLTGDQSINRDGRLVVMTTEVFRNMLYGVNRSDDHVLDSVKYCVLDECHYMNDAERGTVWEESIIYCPEHIQVIALSATVANALELTDWINEVHHDTRLVMSDFRPVPLRFFYYVKDNIHPLFESHDPKGEKRLNKKLQFDRKGGKRVRDGGKFRPNTLIDRMAERDMLPAIFFTFSRKNCDMYMKNTQWLHLLNDGERQRITAQIDEFVAKYPFLKDHDSLTYIANGVASHHAGLLPALKLLVESLFQQGLIKVVFATETLAAGINMPARSTVITAISKRTQDGHRLLTASEFLQMSGRAGRRGMDTVGHVVVVSTPFQSAQEAAKLASSPADPLVSQFTPTYGMVVNLLQYHSLAETEFLIRKSFGQFIVDHQLKPLRDEIAAKEAELEKYAGFECPVGLNEDQFEGYLKKKERLHQILRDRRSLEKQIKHHGRQPEVVVSVERLNEQADDVKATLAEMACDGCEMLDKHRKSREKQDGLKKRIKKLKYVYSREKDIHWQQFLSLYNLLKEAEYLDSNNQPTIKGKMMGALRTENEFLLTEIITDGALDGLSPQALSAVVCALVFDSNRSRMFNRLRYGEECQEALQKISKVVRRVRKRQEKHGVDIQAQYDAGVSGLIEAWSLGMDWDAVLDETSLEAGDLVRLVRRTTDVIRQIAHLEGASPSLRQSARDAVYQMMRDPVKEVEFPVSDEPTGA